MFHTSNNFYDIPSSGPILPYKINAFFQLFEPKMMTVTHSVFYVGKWTNKAENDLFILSRSIINTFFSFF